MNLKYKLGQIYDDKFVYNIEVRYSEIDKYNNATVDYIFSTYLLIDLINDYPKYKFISNDKHYEFYSLVMKYKHNPNTSLLNIGDVRKIKKEQNYKSYKELTIYDSNFRKSFQYEYDKYCYLTNRNTCNKNLYEFIYNYIINYFKSNNKNISKIRETIV